MKQTVVFDFDGVIHSYTSGWKGETVIPDPPVSGIEEAIAEIRGAGYEVAVVSTRCASLDGLFAVEDYLRRHNIAVDAVQAEKPPAVVYIDDRALCFNGDAAGLLRQIQRFEPWYKRTVDGNLSAKALHETVIVPLKMELQRLEGEYRERFRQECGEKISGTASCDNCAYSCIIEVGDHNVCMGGGCTCCKRWCYSWIPENEVSKFLRQTYPHDAAKYWSLEHVFGADFLRECGDPKRVKPVLEMLRLLGEYSGKFDKGEEE